ncbi:MAG TPA: chemotaxis protein CheA [Thermoanaerobaculia bacterium]|nr:chemotaxis protein CheA [Thermoanaerobaculia bacterium]
MADVDLNFDLDRDELLATFSAEAVEHITALEAGLLALEQTPGDAEIRQEVMRLAHTLKGNASCVGFDTFAAFAHAYEAQLEATTDYGALLDGIDTFRRLLAQGESASASASTLRVSVEKLDRMLDLVGEIAILQGGQLDQLHAELQELIMRARMVPIGPLFRQYARTVRDLAARHGKSARLVTRGEDVELDTRAVELLRDPLTHMVRNAIDHGIEPPQQREASGKDAAGTITLEARHEAGMIIVRVSDDGAGLDRRAIAEGNEALIYEPGFTTANEVTDLSGRGVGMDVVRRGIDSLRGTIAIDSRQGAGTTFTLRLPLTLAVIDGFGVAAGDETWIVPMENVVECVELPAASSSDGNETTGVLLLRDEIVPWVRLRQLWRTGTPACPERSDQTVDRQECLSSTRENVLVVQHGDSRAGLVVDALHGSAQAVIKPLGSYFGQIPGIAGSSILGSGRVALILDTAAIVRELENA